jgi:hypothetical protein
MNTSNNSTDTPFTTVVSPPPVTDEIKDVLSEILEWSKDRPGWQRDALRRLFTAGSISSNDIEELTELCKTAHGLIDPRKVEPLKAEHVATKGKAAVAVTLSSVTHRQGVNALAPEQTLAFGPNLTIVYGSNAAGKSGYARILKRACRSRGVEEILGNVLSREALLKAQATIRYREASKEIPLEWTPEVTPPDTLGNVSVFDSHSASVYLHDKTDVAFRPFGLDIFDKLSSLCGAVRARLEEEQAALSKTLPNLPNVLPGTQVRTFIDRLTALTKPDEVRTLATLTEQEDRRLKELRQKQLDARSSDPKQRSRELNLKAQRLQLLMQHLNRLSLILGEKNISAVRQLADDVQMATQTVSLLRKTAITPDLLPGTGDEPWRRMWETTGAFAAVAYPDREFPVTQDARCPFCQQTIGPETANRLQHFAEYVSSNAQNELRSAERKYHDVLAEIDRLTIEPNEITLAVNEIAVDDSPLSERIKVFLKGAIQIRQGIQNAAAAKGSLAGPGLGASPAADVQLSVKSLQDRAGQLDSQTAVFQPELQSELDELEGRMALAAGLQTVLDEIERKKRLLAYRQSLDDTSTTAITRKSTELTKEMVTDNLRDAFQAELGKLEFTHLAIEIQTAGGAKGALFHRLAFTSAPGISVPDVVSEGESRTLSLAAFLTELSTAPALSAIIFDDPVSSLDHMWRERIARRLVTEAARRQVIVFTHDLLFLRVLLDESARQNVPCENQYVRREGQAGICSPALPWFAMPVKERIGKLRDRWQAAEQVSRTSGAENYEAIARDIYGALREAWEQAVSEILLNDVVQRYRHSIETQKLRHLHDIKEEDCKSVEDAMTHCSRWMRGHDNPAADGTPFPQPAELKNRIDDLDNWAKAIRKRR